MPLGGSIGGNNTEKSMSNYVACEDLISLTI